MRLKSIIRILEFIINYVSFEKTANSYFKGAGTEAQFKKPEGSINANFL